MPTRDGLSWHPAEPFVGKEINNADAALAIETVGSQRASCDQAPYLLLRAAPSISDLSDRKERGRVVLLGAAGLNLCHRRHACAGLD